MKLRILYLRCFMFFMSVTFLCSGTGLAADIVFVDTRLLVQAHALYKSFDPDTRRFKGTTSEPVDGLDGLKELASLILKKEQQLKDLENPQDNSKVSSEAENLSDFQDSFLEKKKTLSNEIVKLKTRFDNAYFSSDYPGQTSDYSIVPQVRTIVRDIQKVVMSLKERHKTSIVFDISGFFPSDGEDIDYLLLKESLLHIIYHGTGSRKAAIDWIDNARARLSQKVPGLSPIVIGGIDARQDSVDLIRTLSSEGKK
ncbi:MAG: hypothetical protein HQM10_09735 [Candidatus Riflebacteria bacterium]|nr:hypothetical protein [Candidatus Riflebacteria bacterium]